jgi:cyanophycinase
MLVASAVVPMKLRLRAGQGCLRKRVLGEMRVIAALPVLRSLYGNTPVVGELKMLLYRGGVVGGTSAGASIAGTVMPYDDEEMEGFGLLDGFIVDQHFSNRHREGRLRKLIDRHPGMLGVGIDESTAIIVNDGEIKVIGNGEVHIMSF